MHADHPGVIIDSDAMFGENMFGYSALRGRAAMRSRVGMFNRISVFIIDYLETLQIRGCRDKHIMTWKQVAGGIQACTENGTVPQIIRQCKLSATAALTLQL